MADTNTTNTTNTSTTSTKSTESMTPAGERSAEATSTAIARQEPGEVVATQRDGRAFGSAGGRVYRPAIDLYEAPDRYELHADIPGTSSDRISLTLREGVLSIDARVPPRYDADMRPLALEFGVGDYRRSVRLGEDVDADTLEASYRDGVLVVRLPKRAEHRQRRIEVRAG